MSAPKNPVNWFEIPVTNLDRATKFYESILGVELSYSEMGPLKMALFPMSENGPGAAGSLVQAEGYSPSDSGTVVYLHVEDIEGTLARVGEQGGQSLRPKASIGEHGFIAHFKDCEGNQVALHSMK